MFLLAHVFFFSTLYFFSILGQELLKSSESFLTTKGSDLLDKLLASDDAAGVMRLLRRHDQGSKLLSDLTVPENRLSLISGVRNGLASMSENLLGIQKKKRGGGEGGPRTRMEWSINHFFFMRGEKK